MRVGGFFSVDYAGLNSTLMQNYRKLARGRDLTDSFEKFY